MSEQPVLTDEMIAGRRELPKAMPPDMPRWMAKTILGIDRFSMFIGRIVCWLTLPIIFAMIYEVVARYAFTAPTAWAYDISRFFYGALFILGAGYALSRGVHIRSDFIYRTWSVRTQGRVDAALYLIFFFPTMLILLWVCGQWAWTSMIRLERGMDTSWAPLLGPVRLTLPIGIVFLIIQGFSELLKSIYAASKGKWPDQ